MAEVDRAGGPSTEALAAQAPRQVDEDLVRQTEQLLTISYLLGRDHVATKLELADGDKVPGIPFDEAVDFMRSRVPLTKKEWSVLEPKLRFRAFTVAATSTPAVIDKVRRFVGTAVEKGQSLAESWTEASAKDTAGIGQSPWYWETVYRTNVQTAYNAGRAAEFARVQPEYLEFIGIEDTRQTEICAQRSGTILPASHPFWKKNWPPLHFKCRSTVRAVFQEEVDLLREQDPLWNPTDDSILPTQAAAKGFGGNPIETESFWKMTPSMVSQAETYGVDSSIRAFARDLGLDDYKIADKAIVEPDYARRVVKGDVLDEATDLGRRTLKVESVKKDYLGNEVYTTDLGIKHMAEKKGLSFWGGKGELYRLFEKALSSPDLVVFDKQEGAWFYGLHDPSNQRPYLLFCVGRETGRAYTLYTRNEPFEKMGTRYILRKGSW